MSLSIKTRADVMAVSRRAQVAPATAASLAGVGLTEGMLIHTDEASTINVIEERRDNQDQKTGAVEATAIDILSKRSEGSLTVPRAAPDVLAWMAAFFANSSSMLTPAGGTNSRLHTSRVGNYAETPPYFTSVHRKGGRGGAPAAMERVLANAVNVFRFALTKNEFVTAAVDVQGLGQCDDNDKAIKQEIKSIDFTGAGPFTTVLAYEVEGATDAERATHIFAWADTDDDGFYETQLNVTAFVNATKTVTVSDAGVDEATNVRIQYSVAAGQTGHYGTPSWRSEAESLLIAPEFKLRAGSMKIVLNSKIIDPGTDEDIALVGGQIAGCEVESLEYTGDWQGQIGNCWRAGAVEELEATQVERGDLRQTIRVNRRAKDWLMHRGFLDNDFFSIYVDAVGPEIETGKNFEFRAWFPRCKFLTAPWQASNGRWVQAGEILVLQPDQNWTTDGLENSAVFQVQNAIANGGNGYL